MKVTVQLNYESTPQRAVAAWFIPGGEVRHWVRVLAEAGLAEMGTKLFVVRQAEDDPSASGVLAVPLPRPELRWPRVGMACGLMDQTVCLPVEARLAVPLSREELADLSTTSLLFLHPTLGVSAFTEADVLRVSDLLACPPERDQDWGKAMPGVETLPVLKRIRFSAGSGSLYGEDAEKMARRPLSELPPTPEEAEAKGAPEWQRKLKGWMADQVKNTTSHLELGGGSWKQKLEAWAARQEQAAVDEQSRLRNREIHRLIHMLEDDPELGLRHAIPLSSFPHRGRAQPVTRLGERNVEFDLSRLGGGGAADFWDVPHDLREQLRHRYRQMADAELRAGRFRRAAFIYGELLGDLAASAGALREGRHFREAAVLYSERLNLKLEAARCLAEGGLLREAIDIYQQLNRHLDVAELHLQLGEHDWAEQALRVVVQQRLEAADFLGAAKLLEEKLKLPHEALHVLAAGWPSSSQAVRCLDAQLGLLARLGRHESAHQLIQNVSGAARPMSPPVALLELMSSAARSYPDGKVRVAAADACRVIAAEELSVPHAALEPTLVTQLLEALSRSAPEDRLLARDTQRFLSRVRSCRPSAGVSTVLEQVGLPSAPVQPGERSGLEKVREIQLPSAIQWMHVRDVDGGYLAAGWRGPRFVLARGRWGGPFQVLFWNLSGVPVAQRRIFEVLTTREQQVEVAVPFASMLTPQTFPESDELRWPEWSVSPVSWLGDRLLAIHRGGRMIWALQGFADRVSLSVFESSTGRPGCSLDVTELTGACPGEMLPELFLASVGNGAVIGAANHAWMVRDEREILQLNLPDKVVGLHPTPGLGKAGLVIAHARGAALAWAGQARWMDLEIQMDQPRVGFNREGRLLLVDAGGQGRLIELDAEGGMASVHPFASPQGATLAVLPTDDPRHFALFSQEGRVMILQFRSASAA